MLQALVIGCGFVGKVVADLLFQSSWEIYTTCRTEYTASLLAHHTPYPIKACDVTNSSHLQQFAGLQWDAVIFCASSRGGNEEAYRDIYLRGTCNILKVLRPKKILFASSTSLYAQKTGEMVDEHSPTKPEHPSGKILLEAEKIILGSGGSVARLAGIYGPTRSSLMRKFLTKEARLKDGGERWVNQIHRDDAARALVHLLHIQEGIYNVCDNQPSMEYEVYQWLANFFQKPLPEKGHVKPKSKRGWSNKRVSNQKLRDRQWTPRWESYQAAISSLAPTFVGVGGLEKAG